ncbi:phosphatase PAP2 family protein [Cellulomonas sp. HZM]|uniref:phosphatase PAP2 family protein n=1 Tax=Cellulomonas sp. HZM TaxID=1454010 RepID=UPI001E30C382|nr:phosphatase PAP2 family protein [Cellulomonas sp. HZM]
MSSVSGSRAVVAVAPGRRVGAAAAVVVASALGVWLLWRAFVDTWAGQRVDQAAVDGAQYGRTELWRVGERVLDVVSVGLIAAVLLAAVVIAVLRRRWELAVQVAIVMAGANLTTQVLKKWVFERPDMDVPGDYGNTLPSGHTTAAASISVVLLLVVPPRVRPWAAVLGAGYTALTGVSTLVGQWHRPSDVVAAVLVVLAWTAATCTLVVFVRPDGGTAARGIPAVDAVDAVDAPDASRALRRGVVTALVVAGLAAGAVAVIALTGTYQHRYALTSRTELLTAYAGGAAGIVAASALAFAAALVLRHTAALGLRRA